MKVYLVVKQSNWFDLHGRCVGSPEIVRCFASRRIAKTFADAKNAKALYYSYHVKPVQVWDE